MKTCFLVFLFLSTIDLLAQDYPTYRLYTLEEFSREHVGDQGDFIKQFYMEARYPAISREDELEGKFDVMLLNHSDSSFEVIVNTHLLVFKKNIYETISVIRKKWINTHIPFMTNFYVEYRLKYRQNPDLSPELSDACNFTIWAYAVQEKRDTSYIFDVREITALPKITGFPSFIKSRRTLRKYALDSIESLIEAAIKSCCNKNISLTHQQPFYHAQESYPMPKGEMSIVFHSKGYISKIWMRGQLKEKINEGALLKTLRGIHFVPAQYKSNPAHLRMDYIME